jgi:hypothetical protein
MSLNRPEVRLMFVKIFRLHGHQADLAMTAPVRSARLFLINIFRALEIFAGGLRTPTAAPGPHGHGPTTCGDNRHHATTKGGIRNVVELLPNPKLSLADTIKRL